MTANKAITTSAVVVGWQSELDELAGRKRIAQQIAGKARYDNDGQIIDFMPGNGVFGRGKIDGRPIHSCRRDQSFRPIGLPLTIIS